MKQQWLLLNVALEAHPPVSSRTPTLQHGTYEAVNHRDFGAVAAKATTISVAEEDMQKGQIFAALNRRKVFARIDLSEAYLQIEVEEKLPELLAINTHKGLFRYTRLNCGVKTAPGVLQQIMDTMLKNVPGTMAYMEDIVIVRSSEEELSQRLNQFVDNVIDYGLDIKVEKGDATVIILAPTLLLGTR
ncbi:hypothetical protein SprV_0501854000 [Sparganum proliferum]